MTDRVGAPAPAGRAPGSAAWVFAGFAPRASPLTHPIASPDRIGPFEGVSIGPIICFLFRRTKALM
jgi:hypothetical protein